MDHQSKVKFSTLGCRLNQYETQAIREQFKRAGFEETQDSSEADLFVLNTCTVTRESDRESRYLIRKFHRENPGARIIVTGCYVERNQDEVKSIPGVTLAVLNRQKSEIVELLESCTSFSFAPAELPSKRRFVPLSISEFEGRTRAYVKIQDGCNHACSFCKVVLVRGPARSRPSEEVIEEVKRLGDHGFQEVVLTGIQLGSYGYDLKKRQMLGNLLERLARIPNLKRIRLSSIEPTDVTDELIEAVTSIGKVCPHLHIPLQSGDDHILERMNRRYRSAFYRDLIRKLRERISGFVLTTDVMVGFPGESDREFAHTVELLDEALPYKLHLFPYSAREGTRAARFQDLVEPQVAHQRKGVLFELEQGWRRRVQKEAIGKTFDVLIEEGPESVDWISGRASNYIEVRIRPVRDLQLISNGVRGHKTEAGMMVQARIEGIEDDVLIGAPLIDIF